MCLRVFAFPFTSPSVLHPSLFPPRLHVLRLSFPSLVLSAVFFLFVFVLFLKRVLVPINRFIFSAVRGSLFLVTLWNLRKANARAPVWVPFQISGQVIHLRLIPEVYHDQLMSRVHFGFILSLFDVGRAGQSAVT